MGMMGPPPAMRGGPRGPRGFLTEEEKAQKPTVTRYLIGRILGYLKPYRWHLALVFASIAISSVLALLPTILTGEIVDALISDKTNVKILLELVVLALVVLTASQSIKVLEQYINSWISQKIIYDMRNEMYKHLQYMPNSFFAGEKQGDIITRMNSDINGVSSVITGTLTSLVSHTLTVCVSLFYLLFNDWRLAIVGLLVLPMMILPARVLAKKRWELAGKAQVVFDDLNQQIDETLSVSGSLLMKLFVKEKSEYEKFEGINRRVTGISIKEHRAGSWFRVIMGMLMHLAPLLIYFAGGFLIITGNGNGLTVGGITVVVGIVERMHHPLRALMDIHVDFIRSLALFTRIFDYLDRDINIKNCENPCFPSLNDIDIEFKNVSFGYNNEKQVLCDINFTVPSGQTYAIVGTSGAGKSTIINLIPRLYDVCDGAVKIAGVDIRDIDLSYLRQNIGLVTQDTYLFNSTIRENLLYAKPDATEKELIEACKTANIYDFIEGLEDKWETLVGNRGLKLSGGEKQRISIARVVLKNPKILILDEATSALDSISEEHIQEALQRIMKNRTSIVIAHRLSTIMAADKIMLIENGTIAAHGTHDELLKSSEGYRELYTTQFHRIIEDYEQHKHLH